MKTFLKGISVIIATMAIATFVLIVVATIGPSMAHADAHHMVCGDIPTSSAGCSSGTWTFSLGNESAYSSTGNPFAPDTTYYLSALLEGDSNDFQMLITTDGANSTIQTVSNGQQTDLPVVTPSSFSQSSVYIGSIGFTGILQDLCWSDAPGECNPGGGGGDDATTTAATSTVQVVYDPAEVLGFTFLVFLGSFAIMIFYFRRV